MFIFRFQFHFARRPAHLIFLYKHKDANFFTLN